MASRMGYWAPGAGYRRRRSRRCACPRGCVRLNGFERFGTERLLAPDIGVGDQAPSGDDGFGRRRAVAGGRAQDGERRCFGVAMEGKGVGLDAGEGAVDVDADQRGRLPAGLPTRSGRRWMTTSAACEDWSCEGAKHEPYERSGMVPLPPLEVMTGMLVARDESGFGVCHGRDGAGGTGDDGAGAGHDARNRRGRNASSRSTPASGGISISVGRGRPVRIWRKASETAAGISRGVSACCRHLVTGLHDG